MRLHKEYGGYGVGGHTELQLAQERDYRVVKANEIIQKARFDLSLVEQKTFCYAVSKIKPSDIPGTEYTFAINEYCDVCGIKRNSGRTMGEVKDALKRLRDRSFYLVEPDGAYCLIGWLAKVQISPKSGKIRIKFDEDMQKYLMGLYDNYTQYSLLCVLPMRSSYSVRLYELLKSYSGLKQRQEFDIDDLKARIAAPYDRFPDFRRYALEKAVKEINEFTDIEVSWEPIRRGRKVVKVCFDVKNRKSWAAYISGQRAVDALDGQMTIDDILNGEQKG